MNRKAISHAVRVCCTAQLLYVGSVNAQIPVTDGAILVQQIQQATSWIHQLQAMTDQVNSMSGNKGIGGLVPMSGPYIPAGALNDLNTNPTILSRRAYTIQQSLGDVTDCTKNLEQANVQRCFEQLKSTYEQMSIMQGVIDAAQQKRQTTLQLNYMPTDDVKSEGEANTRVMVEVNQTINDQTQFMATQRYMQLSQRAQMQAREQQDLQARIQRAQNLNPSNIAGSW